MISSASGEARGDDGDLGVAVDAGGEVARLAVDHDGERGLGQARADRGRELGAGDRAGEMALLAVGQGDGDAAGVDGLHRITHGVAGLPERRPRGNRGAPPATGFRRTFAGRDAGCSR